MPARVLPAARSLARRGHQVTVLIPPWDSPEDAGREDRSANLVVRHFPLRGRGRWAWPLLALGLARAAWATHPDVIHFFKPKGFSAWAHLWAWGQRQRTGGEGPGLVVDSDDWEGPGGWNELGGYPPWMQALFAWQERWGLRHADRVTVVSRALEDRVVRLGVPASKVHRVPNALEADHPALLAPTWPGEGSGDPVLLLYSRLWEFDHARTARRLRLLQDRLRALEIWVAGQGRPADEASWWGALSEAGLGPRVRWLGWVFPRALPGTAVNVSASLVPLRGHPVNRARFPVKVLELMALGLPLAADAVGELPELLGDGECGLLLPEEDEAWVGSLAGFLERRDLRLRLGARARERVREGYLWERWAGVLEATYAAVSPASPVRLAGSTGAD